MKTLVTFSLIFSYIASVNAQNLWSTDIDRPYLLCGPFYENPVNQIGGDIMYYQLKRLNNGEIKGTMLIIEDSWFRTKKYFSEIFNVYETAENTFLSSEIVENNTGKLYFRFEQKKYPYKKYSEIVTWASKRGYAEDRSDCSYDTYPIVTNGSGKNDYRNLKKLFNLE